MKHALIATLGLSFAIAGACSTIEDPQQTGDDLGFPVEGGEAGKEDAFGRSLVGAPNPYEVDSRALSDAEALEEEVRSNYKARRDFGWEIARKALEPVPLLALADQLSARPDCPEGVDDRSLDNCKKQTDAASCGAQRVGDFAQCSYDESTAQCAPVCDNLKLPDGAEIPNIPRFQTWYGVEDINHIFKVAYARLDDEAKFRREGLSDRDIGEAFYDNNTKAERISNWPLRRYTKAVDNLFGCELEQGSDETDEAYEDRCAQTRQSQFSGASGPGGGIARILYSPAMAMHTVKNYGRVLDCADDQLSGTWCVDGEPCDEDPENFSTCFETEFPVDAGAPWEELGLPAAGGTAVVKTTWARVGFGFDLPAYDTSAEALERWLGPGQDAHWTPEGDRTYEAPQAGEEAGSFPTSDDIYTIRTRGGSLYRLTGIHVMTKELRHWTWVTLWWSDTPDEDFGADRPASFDGLDPAFKNYKMCVVVDYLEGDGEASTRFGEYPSLQAAINAAGSDQGAPTWCSNPYIEMGEGNARTNCIGCHQHAGTRIDEAGMEFDLVEVIEEEDVELTPTKRYPANGRTRRRNVFATDYSWAFSRIDDLTELFRRQIEVTNASDERYKRLGDILKAEGDPVVGEEVFRMTTEGQACTDCHGDAGQGGIGPNFELVFNQRTHWEVLYTIIEGRGGMPDWGETLNDKQLSDLLAYLSATFDDQDIE